MTFSPYLLETVHVRANFVHSPRVVAERGLRRLLLADIHLYRARLFHAVKPYPWAGDGDVKRGPKDDLKDARKLIETCGYWRRKEELEDAEKAAEGWDS